MKYAGIEVTRQLLVNIVKKTAEKFPTELFYRKYKIDEKSFVSFGVTLSIRGKNDDCLRFTPACMSIIINEGHTITCSIDYNCSRIEEAPVFYLSDEEYAELDNICKTKCLEVNSTAFSTFLTSLDLQ